ncbi:hypothetical protein E2C01_098587 [Portunus trituberculatus]|uniref:Uncharacterized protein n=1 Tax=Portunus trituberculatus TaxID=210409 RepID=A0A5B7K819_PORTR|nr:hypothetical protein [Portunus trituberculatus]
MPVPHTTNTPRAPQTAPSQIGAPGDVVRFSLRCHVLSRRPAVETPPPLGLPETLVPEFTQEDLDAWDHQADHHLIPSDSIYVSDLYYESSYCQPLQYPVTSTSHHFTYSQAPYGAYTNPNDPNCASNPLPGQPYPTQHGCLYGENQAAVLVVVLVPSGGGLM